MKILVVTNLYPPHHQGGYELRCSQVVDYLHRQGHTVRVVTSDFEIAGTRHRTAQREETINGVPVSRFFRQHRLDPRQPGGRRYNLDVVKRQIADVGRFTTMLDDFRPDVVSWWNLEGVTKAILRLPGDRNVPSVQCIDDNWMIREYGANGDADMPLWFDFWRVRWGPRPLRPVVRAVLAPVEKRMQRRGIPTQVFGVPAAHLCFISEYRRYQYRAGRF